MEDSSLYASCSLCRQKKACCDARLTKFPCRTCSLYKTECCLNGYRPSGTLQNGQQPASAEIDPEFPTNTESSIDHDFSSSRCMADTTKVLSMLPLDNLVAEVHDLLGSGGLPPQRKPILPLFLQNTPPWLSDEDLEYLDVKGVFKIPEAKLCRQLLTAFVEHVYPFLPVLDLDSLLHAVIRNDGVEKISLLLFHAVMFSAVAFVDSTHLHDAGLRSRIEARKHFFQKARALYDFDVETDRIVLIQILLLMTYWHESPDNPKDSQYWLDMCWSLGASIGLHRDPSTAQTTPNGKRLWKRIWWCLYTRNLLLALNLCRPISFEAGYDQDPEVPLVDLDDFPIHRYSPDTIVALGDCQFLHNVDVQRWSAINFITKSRLSLLISEVVMLRDRQRSPSSHSQGEEFTEWTWEGQCRKTLERLKGLHLEKPLSNQLEESISTSLTESGRLKHFQWAWNQVELLTSINTLYRHLASSERSASAKNEVANEIAAIMQDLRYNNLVQYLPGSTVALLVPVIATLMLNKWSVHEWALAFQHFYQCMRVLDVLSDTYFSAHTVRQFFEDALGYGPIPAFDTAASVPSIVRYLLTREEEDSLEAVWFKPERRTVSHAIY